MNKILVLIITLFLLTQIPLWFTTLPADENVYYYMAKVVSEGAKPYEDFFFGHPPLQIWMYAGLIWAFGMKIWMLKLFTALISVGCILMVYLIAKDKYDKKVALIASFVFMVSYDILAFGSFAFGVEIAVLFFLVSFYMLDRNNFVSGLFFALCIMTRLHLVVLGVILFLFSKKKREFLAGCSLAIVYYGLLLYIPNFYENVFGYHLIKPISFMGWEAYFKANVHLMILVLFSIRKIKIDKLLFVGGAYLAFLLLLKSTFEYYFLLITVILCIEGSHCLLKSRFKNACRFMVGFWVIMLVMRITPFMYEQSSDYAGFVDYIDTLEDKDKDLMGQFIVPMLALRSDKEITRLQIDLNFQRNEVFDYSDSYVIYEWNRFKYEDFDCEPVSMYVTRSKRYGVWLCPK